MASEEQILKHTEEIEFLKELARTRAEDAVSTIDPIDAASDPEGHADEIVAAILLALTGPAGHYGLDLARRASSQAGQYADELGLAKLSRRHMAAIEDKAKSRFIELARPAILAALVAIAAKVRAAIDAGVSDAVLARSMRLEATKEAMLAPVTSVARSAAATFIVDVERAVIGSALDTLSTELPLEWIAVMDGKTCDDAIENSCAPRHGQSMAPSQWDELGRPGAPQLICSIYAKGGSNCRCVLVPAESSTVSAPVNVSGAIASGRQRARKFFQ